MNLSIATVTLILLVTAAARAQAQVVRDSAGIQIVENPSRTKAPARWRLGNQPTVDLGGRSGSADAQFFTTKSEYGLLAATRLRDGRILVADSWHDSPQTLTTWLKYFSPSGALLTVVKLDDVNAPFGGVSFLCQSRGDTVLIGGSTIGVLDGAGRVVRRFPKDMSGGAGFTDDACLADGSLLMPVRQSGTPMDFTDPQPLLPYVARRTDGSLAHDLGMQPFISPLPSGPKPSIVAFGQSLVVGSGQASEIRVYDLTNRLRRIIRWADIPAPVTAAERAANAGRFKASDARGPLPMRDDPYTASWPAYGRVLTDPTGRIWVEDEDHSAERQQSLMSDGWTAFDSTGRLLGRLVLPKAEAGERRYSIEFGNEEVRLFHLNYLTKTGAKITIYPIVPQLPTP